MNHRKAIGFAGLRMTAWAICAGILLGCSPAQAQDTVAVTHSNLPVSDATSTTPSTTPSALVAPDLQAVIEGAQRTTAFRARDIYRHPAETLSFFGLRPDLKVVEIWPGNGWYAEILAPYLNGTGLLYEALPEDANNRGGAATGSTREAVAFSQKLAANPRVYGRVVVVPFAPPGFTDIKPPGGADMIVTFRNVHNWIKNGTTDAVFAAMFAALKPGGTLGVVEHRAHAGTSVQQMIEKGYVTEDYVIQHAQAAGLLLQAKSEINANPKDTTDHPHGVWSLPPGYAGGASDRATFQAIGESDRMTLKFVKPN